MTIALSDRFNMTPFEVRREKCVEVFRLVDRLNKYAKSTDQQSTATVERRPAEGWF